MHDEPWLIVDTETDGVMTPIHAVEIAAQRMRGWRREGEPFSILLNHDVPIDPGAEAVHGYSRAYLRRHGAPPLEAHAAFYEYAGNLPMVAYNLSFDWNRVLEPEYARLGVPIAGRRGFCALTLTRRVVKEVSNYRLETIKNHFALHTGRSHRGRNDVETTVTLLERIVSPKLSRSGIQGFHAVAAFAKRCPVAACLAHIHGAAPVGMT